MSMPPPLPAEKSDQSLGDRLKAAGQLASRQAQRTRIATVTLSAAYRALGRHAYAAKAFRDEFAEMYAEFDRLTAEKEAIKAAASARPVAQGFTANAKAAVSAAKDMAGTKALELKVSQAFGRFGKAVYDKHGEQSGSSDVVRPVTDALANLVAIDASICALPGAYASLGKDACAATASATAATAKGAGRLLAALPFAWLWARFTDLIVGMAFLSFLNGLQKRQR